ncbi:heme NO-binding domain-containing protein [Primorskyibacter sp. S187A]|uniref:heme NO-binding domain-containing protein n=1 Tax=Primorskyibacter sp. S187A TaxID=3415130 RepID=UPI003C7A740A
MKGIVFTELLRMAENVIGEDAVDDILDEMDLPHGGVYTSVGWYPCSELMGIVGAISKKTGTSVPDLQFAFGKWMHAHFVDAYPAMYAGKHTAFDMLESIEGEVHKEVRKLYDDVELPTFETERLQPSVLKMTYRSARPLKHFCHGLICGCLEYFDEKSEVSVADASTDAETVAHFTIAI